MRKLLAVMIGGVLVTAIILLDPIGWATWQPPEFEFDELDLRAAVEGTWELDHAGSKTRFTLNAGEATIERDDRAWDGMIRAAQACGERSFVRPAAACYSTSMLALAGASVDAPAIRATFHVLGYTFQAGYLDLRVGELRFGADIRPDGSVAKIETDGKPIRLRRIAARATSMSDPAFRREIRMLRDAH